MVARAGKDDSVLIPENSRRVFPSEYLGDVDLVRRLEATREAIFKARAIPEDILNLTLKVKDVLE